MTAIGKLLAVLTLVVSLGILTWSVGVYAQRPTWFEKPEGGDAGDRAFYFDAVKAEADSLTRQAAVASESWGAQAKLLAEREVLRDDRRAKYAQRIKWAHEGHPTDKVAKDEGGYGKGFYLPAVDKNGLYDLDLLAGLPKGPAVVGTDGKPLPGLDGLLDGLAADVAEIKKSTDASLKYRAELKDLQEKTRAEESRLIRMTVIRDSVVAEGLYLETFEVNALETLETVRRRKKQLEARLKILGVDNP